MSAATPPLLWGRRVERIHCVGTGGMGMAPLAVYLRAVGFTVTGEDDALSPEVAEVLQRGGVRLSALPADAELVVRSSAVGLEHPARRRAAQCGLTMVRRGELLAEVVKDLKLVAVCGSHGKTTTTAMLATVLREARFPAGYVLGGMPADSSLPPAGAGGNGWVVAEVDESDGTIGRFHPEITLVVNLDWDHPDHYHRPEELEREFAELIGRTRGPVLVYAGCERSRRLAPAAATFGTGGDFAMRIEREDTAGLSLRLGGRFPPVPAQVRARGDFNANNAAAALAAASLMGVAVTGRELAGYPGVNRRQTLLHEGGGLKVWEDYAHHPEEIRALLGSLHRQQAGAGRLLVVFQPHRYSRTAQFKADFARALEVADRLYLLEVYPAGESPVPGGATGDLLAECARRGKAGWPVVLAQSGEELGRLLTAEVRPGDDVAFVGAGDIEQVARGWVAGLVRKTAARPDWDALADELRPQLAAGTVLRREEPLARKTTLRVGGAARLYVEPASEADLQTVLRAAKARRAAVYPLGRGSNLIIPDEGVDGVVVALHHACWSGFTLESGGRVRAGAGLRIKNFCGLAARAGLGGFEFLEGIPGSVGGVLRMNAGAMGQWVFDVVEEVRFMSLDGEISDRPKASLRVAYRHCAELDHALALSAVFKASDGGVVPADEIARQMDVYRRKRHESQPREPSAGCIFKNPPGDSAGRLIDASGLKGERIGDAAVSEVHANFIINRGHATGADVLALVRRVRAAVHERQGVWLEPEVLLYGRDWSAEL